MNIIEEIKNLETILKETKSLPGTSKVMIDKSRSLDILKDVIENLPSELDEAGMVTRQKEAIIDQADKEAVRIRNYADEESSTMREIAKRDAAEKERKRKLAEDTQKANEQRKKDEERMRQSQIRTGSDDGGSNYRDSGGDPYLTDYSPSFQPSFDSIPGFGSTPSGDSGPDFGSFYEQSAQLGNDTSYSDGTYWGVGNKGGLFTKESVAKKNGLASKTKTKAKRKKNTKGLGTKPKAT